MTERTVGTGLQNASNEAGDSLLLSVVVPTRNEAANLQPLLEAIAGSLHEIAYEVIVVDDSTDDTPEVARALASQGYPVRLIARPPSRRNGLSGAVVEGIEAAEGDWVCVMDADLQHPPATIRRLLDQATRSGANLVVASRRADWLGPLGLSRIRSLTSQSLTVLARMLFPRVLKNVSDPLTGFFLVRRERVNTSILQPQGFKILLEILVRHPELHVSEITFDFAPRHQGQSKADLNEGLRFFRHAIRLRTTVNQHLVRFVLLVVGAIALNLALLAALVQWADWALLPAASLAGGITVLAVLAGERWVFSDRPQSLRRPLTTLILGLLFLVLIYLPVTFLLSRVGVPYLLASTGAMTAAGFGYYLLSESWIWTRGLMMQPRDNVYYDLHGILLVASQVPMDELDWFQVSQPNRQPDLLIRVDRHGTPNRVEGGISYDERLSRFGFGLTVVPGDYTEIVVSPLLQSSPAFLFTNVVEPVLHWQLVTRDYALVQAGGIASASSSPASAMLVSGPSDMGFGLSRICLSHGMRFMGDDRLILARDGRLFAYPKPVTVNQDLLQQASAATRAVAPLSVQRVLYSPAVRRLGLWFGERRLPVATLNTNLQRLVPQPKYQMQELAPNIQLTATANATGLLLIQQEEGADEPMTQDEVISHLTANPSGPDAFQPRPLLQKELGRWRGEDWRVRERSIISDALRSVKFVNLHHVGANWWQPAATVLSGTAPSEAQSPGISSISVQSA